MLTGDVRKKESCGKLGVLHYIRKGDKVKIREEDKVFIVYKIVNDVNGKVYIGQTYLPLKRRLKRHIHFALHEKKSENVKFARAIRKYGPEHFQAEQIEICEDQKQLDEREWYWIQYYNAVEEGYNSKNCKGKCGGDTLTNHPNREDICKRISKQKMGDNNPMRKNGGLKGERNGMYGKRGSEVHNSKKCVGVNSVTGEVKVFESQVEAARYVGLKGPGLSVGKRIRKETTSEYKGWMFYSYEEYLETQETTESVDSEKDVIE